MKKIYSFAFAALLALSANAQLTTNSNYDVNADGKVTVTDATATVSNYVSGDKSEERQVVDAAALNSVLKSIEEKLQMVSEIKDINSKLENVSNRLSAIEAKIGLGGGAEEDPYNGHEYVDLGTGVKWATMNVGASSPEDYGYYFAWGATTPQSVYDWENCPYQTQKTTNYSDTKFTKYLGSTTSSYKDSSASDEDAIKSVLDLEDDAAHVKLGGNWRMPTKAEQEALRSQCYWKWVTTYNGKNVNGYIVYKAKSDADKGKCGTSYSPSDSYSVSDPHIFLPAAGYRIGSGLEEAGSYGRYWSSSLHENNPYSPYALLFKNDNVNQSNLNRRYGQSVRAVCK